MNTENTRMMEGVGKETPLWKAWEKWRASDHYKSTEKWASWPEHVEGSLWGAFYHGWLMAVEATDSKEASEDGREEQREDRAPEGDKP